MKETDRSRPRFLRRVCRAPGRCALAFALALGAVAAFAGPPRDRLTLLVPDGADRNAWQVKVWTDSAAEEGIRLDLLTDSALLAMGTDAPNRVGGLVVPDSAHLRASDALVDALKKYTYLGGKLMLVYDAGVLTDGGFYPLTGNSRFKDLVGVDYVFWNNGLGAGTMVGFGQVVGTKARLESLSFPPGKYVPYVAPASLASTTLTTAFVPASARDPSGTQVMTSMVADRAGKGIEDGTAALRNKRPVSLRELLALGVEASGPLRFDRRNPNASTARDRHLSDVIPRGSDQVAARFNADARSWTELSSSAAASADSTLQAISGYAFGPLNYFHYVTTGDFPGTVHLSSPEHGLVAGTRNYGSGQLLFVNLPLGYFKAIGTDAAPLHGYLSLFARDQVGISTLSAQPRGIGGMIYNWHVDDGDDLTTYLQALTDQRGGVMTHGPYSIHLTAGPDVIRVGDGDGMDLPHNKKGQELVLRLAGIGKYAQGSASLGVKHEIGSHGGWIHDYWGLNANEANVPDLTSLLVQNFDAIEATTGVRIREYSSPVGNTPTWAVKWLEKRGVVAMYLVGDVGAGMLRSWRAGARLTDKLWTAPVTPYGKYATFEEFDAFGIGDAMSGQWLLDLQSFVVNRRTNRLFYNHPPGAAAHLGPVGALVTRADQLQAQGRFGWYTMAGLADFSQRRVDTTWSSTTTFGMATFNASHPTSLKDVTWLLPKARYWFPIVLAGAGWVDSDDANWLVVAGEGKALRFTALER